MSGPGRDKTVSDEDILEVFRSSSDPVLTTSEVASQFDLTHRGIRNRLEALEENSVLRSKKVGARGKVWWDPDHTMTSGNG